MPWIDECPHGHKVVTIDAPDRPGWKIDKPRDCKVCTEQSHLPPIPYKTGGLMVPARQAIGDRPIIAVLSGGQDSTTALAWALKGMSPENKAQSKAVFFDYGQKHLDAERRAAENVATYFGIAIDVLKDNILRQLGDSALMTHGDVNAVDPRNGLPASFTPGRNVLFLLSAALVGYKLGHKSINLVTGVCQTDFSGYPDCRQGFCIKMAQTLQAALAIEVNIHTPLMFLTKAQTVELMASLGQIEAYKYTHTCYNGKRPPCGECPACKLRAKGFADAGILDPIVQVAA